MKRYKVLIHGQNFLIDMDKKVKKLGFVTTRFVKADSPQNAENQAMNLIREELKDIVLNDKSDTPMMNIEEVSELISFGQAKVPGKGFTWYGAKE